MAPIRVPPLAFFTLKFLLLRHPELEDEEGKEVAFCLYTFSISRVGGPSSVSPAEGNQELG